MTQVFISYSRKDLSFVERLAADLKKAGFDVWYDVSGIRGGSRWRAEIENGLRTSQFAIVVLSPDAIVSEWVEREFLFASDHKLKIIPLFYRKCELPLNYLNLNYIDVQGDDYWKNFNEILRALNQTTLSSPTTPRPARKKLALFGGALFVVTLALGGYLIRDGYPFPENPSNTPTITKVTEEPSPTTPAPDPMAPSLTPASPTPHVSAEKLIADLSLANLSIQPYPLFPGNSYTFHLLIVNHGNGIAQSFDVQWWNGENKEEPTCMWKDLSLQAGEEKELECTASGFSTWYYSINTEAIVDSSYEIAESNEENNTEYMPISLEKPSTVHISFDKFLDESPITQNTILEGNEFFSQGIVIGISENRELLGDCDAAFIAIHIPYKPYGIPNNFLTTASNGYEICNYVPLSFRFPSPVQQVMIRFYGGDETYAMEVFDGSGNLLGTDKTNVITGSISEVSFKFESRSISQVHFGKLGSLIAITDIYFQP